MVKLFIVGFPKDMQEITLVEMFSAHGIVNNITIVTDIQTGASKGYGFVTMIDEAGAVRAISALNGAEIGSRTINVRIADDKSVKEVVVPEKTSNELHSPDFSDPFTVKKKRPRRTT